MTILRRSVAWTLTLLFLAANLLVAFPAIAADAARVAVYNETFESGTGGFVAQGGEIKLARGTDALGNHYIMVAVNPDKAEIADWAKPAVNVCTSVGLISGMTDTTFEGDKTATRAQTPQRLLDK